MSGGKSLSETTDVASGLVASTILRASIANVETPIFGHMVLLIVFKCLKVLYVLAWGYSPQDAKKRYD